MVTNARRLVALLSLLLTGFGLAGPAAAQIPYANLLWSEPRYAAVVVDANTGEVLYEKNADSPRYPASITKIMTLYLTFEALSAGRLSLSDSLVVSPHAASMAPTKLGLRPGEVITVDDAVRAIAVKSANDMAVALAEKLGGTEAKFAALMTLRAQELGMANTQFVNASGLPDSRQLSTARDIAILSRSVMRDYPQYYSYFGLHQFSYRGELMSNHNHLLDSMPGVDGLKTGYTNASGFNLAASATRDGRRLITVVMGGSSTAARDNNVEDLLNTGFEVLRRRDRGETITIAQSLFEPEPSGPITRPQVEQGDADQRGLKIVVNDDAFANVGTASAPPQIRPAVLRVAARPCTEVRSVKMVRGRHGRRTRVETTSRRCEGAHAIAAADVKPCKASRKGRHHKAVCAAPRRETVSEKHASRSRHHGRATKVAYRGDWQVQVGAFRSHGDARLQLTRISARYAEHFTGADAQVGGAEGGVYRARFTGLSPVAARHACATLKAQGQACIPIAGD